MSGWVVAFWEILAQLFAVNIIASILVQGEFLESMFVFWRFFAVNAASISVQEGLMSGDILSHLCQQNVRPKIWLFHRKNISLPKLIHKYQVYRDTKIWKGSPDYKINIYIPCCCSQPTLIFNVLLLDFVPQVLKSWRLPWIIRQCGLLKILVKNTNLILIFPWEINAVPCYCSREASSEQEPQLTRASFWDRQAAAFYRNREQSFCLFCSSLF